MPGGALRLDGRQSSWASSSARYYVAHEHEGTLLTVAVRCALPGIGIETHALLDTGAAWSLIGGDLADMIIEQKAEARQTIILSTRLGRIRGELQELDLLLPAEHGESLRVTGSVVVATGWTGPMVLGYRGFLERLRFALDPGTVADDAWFFFGSVG